jgi:hypothetical protein
MTDGGQRNVRVFADTLLKETFYACRPRPN